MQLVNNPEPFTGFRHKAGEMNAVLRWFPALALALVLASVLGASYLLGKAEKPADDVTLLTRMASRGNTGAEIQLGMAYQSGQYGLEKNASTAFAWLKRAADLGDAYAEELVANAYAKGLGVEQDKGQAEKWWRKAIQDGNEDARLQLGEALVQQGHLREAKQFLK